MKRLLSVVAIVAIGFTATAQNQSNQTTSATQTVDLLLSNAIDIEFTANGTTTGPAVIFNFTTINDYVNGIESSPQEIKVRSNKKFNVEVKANATNFSYTGSTTPVPVMPVAGVLSVLVSANTTGGTIEPPFSAINYRTLRDFNQYLIVNGAPGADQRFSVKYKATPGFAYPAGAYAIDVVYTATQL